jgi:hypothetical protein
MKRYELRPTVEVTDEVPSVCRCCALDNCDLPPTEFHCDRCGEILEERFYRLYPIGD